MNTKKIYLLRLLIGIALFSTHLYSSAQFPSITIEGGPSENAVWYTGDGEYISWTSSDVTDVIVRFSENGGDEWTNLDTVPASNVEYLWNIPDTIHTDMAVIELAAKSDPTVVSQSNTFHIISHIKFFEPDLADTLQGGTTEKISWKMNTFEGDIIEASLDSGQTWTTLTQFFSDTVYNWNVPDTSTNDVFIRGATFNGADTVGPLTIASSGGGNMSLTLSTPDAGDLWTPGDTRYIAWTSNNVNNIIIHFSNDAGVSFTTLDTVPASAAEYGWAIPDSLNTTEAMISAKAESDFSVYASSGIFSIQPPVYIVEPDKHDTLYGGTSTKVSWKMTTFEGNAVETSLDSGQTWTTQLSFFSDTVFYWDVPDTVSNDVFIRVETFEGADTVGPLVIVPEPALELTYPTGGETFHYDSLVEIHWNHFNIAPSDSLNLFFINVREDTVFKQAITTRRADSLNQHYMWQVPDTSTYSGVIGIEAINMEGLEDYTDDYITIIGSGGPSLSVDYPKGEFPIRAGRTEDIRINPQNIGLDDTVGFYLSTDGGQSYELLFEDGLKNFQKPSEGPVGFQWKRPWYVPFSYTDSAIIKISAAGLNAYSDTFSIAFQSNPSVTFTSPLAGETLTAGDSITIQWDTEDLIPDGYYTLYLKKQGDFNLAMIDTTSQYTKWNDHYTYKIPSFLDGNKFQFVLRERTFSGERTLGESDTFNIESTSPANLEITNTIRSYTGGDTMTVHWDTTNLEGSVILFYSLDSFQNPYIINSFMNVAEQDSTDWIVPSVNDDTVTLYAFHDAYGFMNDTFNISIEKNIPGAISILEPNAGDTLNYADNPHSVEWMDTNITDGLLFTPYKDIFYEYSIDGGDSWDIANISGITQPFGFFVPKAVQTDKALFRISGQNTPYQSVSDTFAIWDSMQGYIDLIFPAGGDEISINKDTTLYFETNLAEGTYIETPIRIKYSKNGDDFRDVATIWNWSDTSINSFTFSPDKHDITAGGYIKLSYVAFEDMNEEPFIVTDGMAPYLQTDKASMEFGSFTGDTIMKYHLDAVQTGNRIMLKANADQQVNPFSISIDEGQTFDTLVVLPNIKEYRDMPVWIKMKEIDTIQSVQTGKIVHRSGSFLDTVFLNKSADVPDCDVDTTMISQTICEGESFRGYTVSGVYYETYLNSAGCDSIVEIDISVEPRPFIDISADQRIFSGDSVQLHVTGGENYEWTPAIDMDGQFTANPVVYPDQTQTFYVTATGDNGCESADSVTVSVIIEPDQQMIPLTAGWNIISFNLDLLGMDMMEVVEPLINDTNLIKVQDERGAAIEKPMDSWMNNIGKAKMAEGYKIKVQEIDTLYIEGVSIDLPYRVYLNTGWNIVGVPYDTSKNAARVFSPLRNNFRFVKAQDESGASMENIEPLGFVNNLGMLEPGKGYKLKIVGSGNFQFKSDFNGLKSARKTSISPKSHPTNTHFKTTWKGNGFDHMNLYVHSLTINGEPIETGDEIAVYDGPVCVGVAKYTHNGPEFISLAASKDDPTTDYKDGYQEGNEIQFKVWDASEQKIYQHVKITTLKGHTSFKSMGSAVYNLSAGSGTTNVNPLAANKNSLGKNFPNPFSQRTTFEFSLSRKTNVTLAVYDLSGEMIKVLANKEFDKGIHQIPWNRLNDKGMKVPEGVYIYKLKTNQFEKMRKMVIQ